MNAKYSYRTTNFLMDIQMEFTALNEAIRAGDFKRSSQLILKFLRKKLGAKVYLYPTTEKFIPAGGRVMSGIRYFLNGNQSVRLNWLSEGKINSSNGLVSMDFWDGSKNPQPFPSHHVKFNQEQSLTKVLPMVVDFVSGKIDRSTDGVYVNEVVEAPTMSLTFDFNDKHIISEAAYTSGEISKTISNTIHALEQGLSPSDQYKAGGTKKYGPRWNVIIDHIKANYPSVFGKSGVKLIVNVDQVKNIKPAAVLAAVSGGDDAVTFTTSAGSREEKVVDGVTDADVDRMTYEEQLDALKTGMKLLMSNATNAIFVGGRGGTGKTQTVEDMLHAAGKQDGSGFYKITGSATPAGIYRLLFQHRKDILLFDDSDSALADQDGRNLFKAASDTKKKRKLSWQKGGKNYVDPDDYNWDDEGDQDELPRSFDFEGKIIFISNLPLSKLDPDGALRTRGFIINVDPTDQEMLDFMKKIASKIPLDVDYNLSDRERHEVIDVIASRVKDAKTSKTVNLRMLVRGLNTRAGIEMSGGSAEEWKKFVKFFA